MLAAGNQLPSSVNAFPNIPEQNSTHDALAAVVSNSFPMWLAPVLDRLETGIELPDSFVAELEEVRVEHRQVAVSAGRSRHLFAGERSLGKCIVLVFDADAFAQRWAREGDGIPGTHGEEASEAALGDGDGETCPTCSANAPRCGEEKVRILYVWEEILGANRGTPGLNGVVSHSMEVPMVWGHLWRSAAVVAVMLVVDAVPGGAQRLTWLGGRYGYAYGVSADGSVVVGQAENASGYLRAFRWTASSGLQDLGTLGGDESRAYGVSADGSVVVGWAENASGYRRAFRWTASSGLQDLGTLGGDRSEAYGVSADGSVVVGWAENASGYRRAFRWTASSGLQDLGTLGGDESRAYGVSADGSVVVGGAANVSGQERAFRWTASSGLQDLGTLGDAFNSWARGVSADGSVVVGQAANASGDGRAIRWTAEGGLQDLGTLPGSGVSIAYGVSADGSVVVGGSSGRAFRWTGSGGMEDLNTTYASLLTDGSVLYAAYAISPDGRFIVGYGSNAATSHLDAFLLEVQTTGVEETVGPRSVILAQNVPNPFTSSTVIRFVLSELAQVKLTVVDLLSREVVMLVDGELNPGEHSVVFDAQNLPSGVYFYRLRAGASVLVGMMELIR